MARKATHRGICQSCGRLHKLPGGRLSIHGYTVDWGYFNGTCGGTHSRPLEEDRGLLDETVKLLELEAGRLEAAEPTMLFSSMCSTSRYKGRKRVVEGGTCENTLEAFRTLTLGFLGDEELTWLRHGWTLGHFKVYNFEGTEAETREKILTLKFEEARECARRALRSKAVHYRHHADYLTDLADRVHGKPLKEIAA